MALSIRQLIQSQTKGDKGETLPTDASVGMAEWFPGHSGSVAGRMLVSNRALAMARNFSCAQYEYLCAADFSAFNNIIIDGEDVDFGSLVATICLGYSPCDKGGTPEYQGGSGYNYYWSSLNTNVISISKVNSDGSVNTLGVAPGSTTVSGEVDDGTCDAEGGGPGYVFRITSISPATFIIGTSGTLQINGGGLSGKGTPNVVFDGAGISVSGVTVQNDSTVTANYSVSCSASASQVQLKFPSDDNVATNTRGVSIGLPNAPAPTISFGGNDVTNTTQNVVVGQQIALTGNLPSPPPCLSVSSESWRLSGTYPTNYVGGYSHNLQGGAISAPTLNQVATTFYWATQGNSQNALLTLNYNTGQQASAQVGFNVDGPTAVSVDPLTGKVGVDLATNKLQFGQPPDTGISINASATPPSGDSGTFTYEQIITKWNVVYYNGGNCSFSQGTGLDSQDPYSTGSSTQDTPGIPLFSNDMEATADFAATTYLMWQSGTSGSISVPLGYVSWNWLGDAVQNSGSWSLKSGSNNTPTFTPSSSFPQWTTSVNGNTPPQCH